MEQTLPLLEKAGVGVLHQGAEEAQGIPHAFGLRRLGDGLVQGLVELGEVA